VPHPPLKFEELVLSEFVRKTIHKLNQDDHMQYMSERGAVESTQLKSAHPLRTYIPRRVPGEVEGEGETHVSDVQAGV